jgi:glycosyltransferase involved in cell wall biosynthesis
MWSRMLSTFGEVIVITRANNREAIESATPDDDLPVRYEYVDLPAWARFWKREKRGIRLYYLLWQMAAYKKARRLMRDEPVDLVWHVSLAMAWLGSSLAMLKAPFIFGPVSGGVPSSWEVSLVGTRGLVKEVARSLVRTAARVLNPLARLAWARASLILTNNEDTRRWLPGRYHDKTEVFPNVVLEVTGEATRQTNGDSKKAIYAGELLPLKGIGLAIMALGHLPGWTLDIYGKGPDQSRLQEIARDKGVLDRVRFMGWVDRDELFRVMESEADVLLFPSLHDEVGWVVAEALAHGLPVVALDRGGPSSLGATTVHFDGMEKTAAALAQAAQVARPAPAGQWDPKSRSEALRAVLERRGLM